MMKSNKISSLLTKCGKQDLQVIKSTAALFSTTHGNNESDYLHKSVIPTMHFQKSLPRLAIPKLEDTIERYLTSQKPLLDSEQYIKTKGIAENFLGYEGRALHAELMEKDKSLKHTSYISGPWYDMYLRYRDSIVLNHNPFILTNDDPNTTDQVTRATKLIYNALRFKKSLDNHVLEPDVFHLNPKKSDTNMFRTLSRLAPGSISWYVAYMFNAYPLDMSQYSGLFNTTRVPKPEKDELKTVKDGRQILVIRNGNMFLFDALKSDDGRQILVIRNGNMFLFDALKSDGSLVSREDIYANLSEIMSKSDTKAEYALPVLTSENRDKWAALREHLISNPTNASLLDKLDSALFGVFLDDEDCLDEKDATRMFLYGEGHSRWFDKSFHMALSKDAKMSINFEHSWGDGVAVMRFINETIQSSEKDTFTPSGDNANTSSTVEELNFSLDQTMKDGIIDAQRTFEERTSKLSIHAQKIMDFGRNDLKTQKLSPDAVIQLAFQMAFYRQSGKFVPTYESCSTAAFKHGRTETLRPCTVATVACSEAFEPSHPAGVPEMLALLKESSNVHSKLTKEAVMGQGFDRHLFALRYIANNAGKTVEFFDDEAYKNINTIILSTSTVFSPNIQMGGFAPVTPNGFGVGYLVHDDWMGCNVSSYSESPNGNEFVELVIQSLKDIQSVLSGRNFKQ